MKTSPACLALLIALSRVVLAQDHLVPDASAFVDRDTYLLKVRHIFTRAFDEGIMLRSLVIPLQESATWDRDVNNFGEKWSFAPRKNILSRSERRHLFAPSAL